jgi:hypothetical protein
MARVSTGRPPSRARILLLAAHPGSTRRGGARRDFTSKGSARWLDEYFTFADYPDWSWAYAIRLTADPADSNPVTDSTLCLIRSLKSPNERLELSDRFCAPGRKVVMKKLPVKRRGHQIDLAVYTSERPLGRQARIRDPKELKRRDQYPGNLFRLVSLEVQPHSSAEAG